MPRVLHIFASLSQAPPLYLVPVKVNESPLLDEERSRRFFYTFFPWVNEQLTCVYAYLKTKVSKVGSIRLCSSLRRLHHCITDFEEIAAHDVEQGETPIDWTLDAHYIPRVQE